MCGRFTATNPKAILLEMVGEDEHLEIKARYNVTPGQTSTVVTVGEDGSRRLTEMRWGLVPSWVRKPTSGHRMINARVETVAEKPAFRDSIVHRRCVVAADGFYEWKRDGGRKRPMRITVAHEEPFAFAGLF